MANGRWGTVDQVTHVSIRPRMSQCVTKSLSQHQRREPSAISHQPSTVPLAWHRIRFDVPCTWETVRYKNDPDDGAVILSDRHGETMQVYWRRPPGDPAVDRRLSELVAENLGEGMAAAKARAALVSIADWRVFVPRVRDVPVFAGRYLSEARILLQLTLPPHPNSDPRKIVRELLASYRPNDGDRRRWAMFGIDITLPKEYAPSDISPLPAAQVVRFENRQGHSVALHRYGMLSRLLANETFETFFVRVTGRRRRLFRRSEFCQQGKYPGLGLAYSTRGKGGVTALLSRRWEGSVWIWRCDDIQRLYCLDHHAPLKCALSDLPEYVVSR